VDDSIVTDPFCTIKPTSLRDGGRLDKISADRHRGQRERRVPQTPRSTTRFEVGLLRDVVDIYVNGLVRVPSYPCFKPPAFEWRGLDPLVLLFQLLSTLNPFRLPSVFLRYGSTPWFLPRQCSHSAAIGRACHQTLFVLSTRPTSASSPTFPPSLPRPTLPIQVQGPPPDRSSVGLGNTTPTPGNPVLPIIFAFFFKSSGKYCLAGVTRGLYYPNGNLRRIADRSMPREV
jgi:hypothetical protein